MSIIYSQDSFANTQVLDLVTRERNNSLSRREWKHRLAGYGYSIRETDKGDIVESLRTHAEVCMLPANIAA